MPTCKEYLSPYMKLPVKKSVYKIKLLRPQARRKYAQTARWLASVEARAKGLRQCLTTNPHSTLLSASLVQEYTKVKTLMKELRALRTTEEVQFTRCHLRAGREVFRLWPDKTDYCNEVVLDTWLGTLLADFSNWKKRREQAVELVAAWRSHYPPPKRRSRP